MSAMNQESEVRSQKSEFESWVDARRSERHAITADDRRRDYEARFEFDLDIDAWLYIRKRIKREEFSNLPAEQQIDVRAEYLKDSEWHWHRRSRNVEAAR